MKRKSGSMLSRRDWMRVMGAVGLDAAASVVTKGAATATERNDLIYHRVIGAAPWATRYSMGFVVFQDRLWVLGGTGTLHNGTQFNDVWSSGDGLRWKRELASASWEPRWAHATFSFADKLWVISGLASLEPVHNLNDIWSSPDGKKWTRVVENAPWHDRHGWATTIHRNRMYLLGGASVESDGLRYYQDVLSSGDGLHWRTEPIKGTWFEKRKDHAAASYHGKIFLTGGAVIDPSQRGGARLMNDVWQSEDGKSWTRIVEHAPWSPRCCHALAIYLGMLWLVGGAFVGQSYATDLWSTGDGRNWKQETDRFAWPPRFNEGVAVFKDQVWIVGGTTDSWGRTSRNDIWTFTKNAKK